jgi:hypothetical protein
MNSDEKGNVKNQVGVELKYCEHCGGLWVRERGAGIYCGRCESKVADLPNVKRKRRNPMLPVRPHTAVDDYKFEIEVEDAQDFEASGDSA